MMLEDIQIIRTHLYGKISFLREASSLSTSYETLCLFHFLVCRLPRVSRLCFPIMMVCNWWGWVTSGEGIVYIMQQLLYVTIFTWFTNTHNTTVSLSYILIEHSQTLYIQIRYLVYANNLMLKIVLILYYPLLIFYAAVISHCMLYLVFKYIPTCLNTIGRDGCHTVVVEERSCHFWKRQSLNELSSLGRDVIKCEMLIN